MCHYINKRRATIYKSAGRWPILMECMGAKRWEGTPRRLKWWHQTLDYTGEDEGEEAESTGGLDSSALPARSPPMPPLPRRPRSPVELLGTA